MSHIDKLETAYNSDGQEELELPGLDLPPEAASCPGPEPEAPECAPEQPEYRSEDPGQHESPDPEPGPEPEPIPCTGDGQEYADDPGDLDYPYDPDDPDDLDEMEREAIERLMSRYVFDEETGMVYELTEKPRKPFAPIAAAGICAALLAIAIVSSLLRGARLMPPETYTDGESILSESTQRLEEQENQLPEQQEEQQQDQAVVYIPASITVEGEVIATLASAEAAYSLLDEVTAHFDSMVEGEGERTSQFMDEPAVLEAPGALPEEIESFEDAFARFTSSRSPLRVMTTLTVTEVEEIPIETEEQEDKELMEGTSIILSQGRPGSTTTITRNVYINGDRSSSRSGTEKQKIQPQDRVIVLGEQEYDEDEDSPGRREGNEGPDAGDFDLTFIQPIQGDIELNYGQVRGVLHLGLDYGDIEEGAKVLASCGGTVVSAMERGGYGLMIEIDHGSGFVTRYAGLGSIEVALGDKVQQGQPIASPGSVEKRALHFEVRIDGLAYNPRYYID